MREERGAVAGPLVVHEPLTLWGTCGGTVTVVEGGKFYMRGSIYGDLNVEYGGRVHVYGNITGDLKVARGSKVILSGIVAGDATNEGGRLYVDAQGEVKGKTRTLKGETRVEPKPLAAVAGRDDDDERPTRVDLTGGGSAASAELAAEAERVGGLLKGKVLARVWHHRPEAMGIEFADGTKLYVSLAEAGGLEMNVSGKLSAAPPPDGPRPVAPPVTPP